MRAVIAIEWWPVHGQYVRIVSYAGLRVARALLHLIATYYTGQWASY